MTTSTKSGLSKALAVRSKVASSNAHFGDHIAIRGARSPAGSSPTRAAPARCGSSTDTRTPLPGPGSPAPLHARCFGCCKNCRRRARRPASEKERRRCKRLARPSHTRRARRADLERVHEVEKVDAKRRLLARARRVWRQELCWAAAAQIGNNHPRPGPSRGLTRPDRRRGRRRESRGLKCRAIRTGGPYSR